MSIEKIELGSWKDDLNSLVHPSYPKKLIEIRKPSIFTLVHAMTSSWTDVFWNGLSYGNMMFSNAG